MGAFSCFFASFLLFISLNFHPGLCREADDSGGDVVTRTEREATEMLTGAGGTSPAPSALPPSEPLQPQQAKPRFENALLQRDYFTIQRFAKRIQSDPKGYKKTWVGTNICKYRGFTCEKLPGGGLNALAAVDFNGANFQGTNLRLDDFLEKLLELAIFHANSNGFKGTVPQNVSKLPYLYELDLSNNKLSGAFPTEVIKSTNLTFVDLRFNNFQGVVPMNAFNLDVDVLFINNNGFNQSLPNNIGSTPALFVTFANNKFTGSIPRSIGKAKNLREVLFLNNRLSGCLPQDIGSLNQATVFDASRNNLTGSIPESFGCLTKMEILNLAINQLYGQVPESVCTLRRLAKLSLGYNYITQVGPECRKLIKQGKLDVRRNCILGEPNQRLGPECAAFFSKHKNCPNVVRRSPCQKASGRNTMETNSEEKKSIGPASGTYSTLVPHGP